MPLGSTQYFAKAMTKLNKHRNVFSNPVVPNPFGTMNHLRNLMKTSPFSWGKQGTLPQNLDKTLRISMSGKVWA